MYLHPATKRPDKELTLGEQTCRKMGKVFIPDNVALITVKSVEEYTGGVVVDFIPSDESMGIMSHRVEYGASKYGSDCAIDLDIAYDIDVDGSIVIRAVEFQSHNNIKEAGSIEAWVENNRKARANRKNIK